MAYVVTKHGLVGMTKCQSNEWAGQGVTVNCIAPGFIETDMLARLDQDKVHKEAVINRIPAGRLGKPDDVVGAMLFLASDAGRYVTGQTLLVDGGWLGR
jgi:2-deoxy-D-gluconate 3-dehydrogenase